LLRGRCEGETSARQGFPLSMTCNWLGKGTSANGSVRPSTLVLAFTRALPPRRGRLEL